MAQMTREQVAEIFKQLDVECYNCDSKGFIRRTGHNTSWTEDCDVCYGTGYQVTGAGVELLNFLRRQKKRIEREVV